MHYCNKVDKKIIFRIAMAWTLLLGTVSTSMAQQQLLFTQYMFNKAAVNPAYAGSDEALNVTALLRRQWIGFDGGPSYQAFTIHKSIDDKPMAIGAVLNREKVAVSEALNFYALYAYKIKTNAGLLSLGLQAGITHHQQNLSDLRLPQGVSDPSFDENLSKVLPNPGTATFFNTDKYYVGLSAPF